MSENNPATPRKHHSSHRSSRRKGELSHRPVVDWEIKFIDIMSGKLAVVRVPKGGGQLWYEVQSNVGGKYKAELCVLVASMKMRQSIPETGVEVVFVYSTPDGSTTPTETATVAWDAHEMILGGLRKMAESVGVPHNIPTFQQQQQQQQQQLLPPPSPQQHKLHTRGATALQGGRLCLKEGLIEKLLSAKYGRFAASSSSSSSASLGGTDERDEYKDVYHVVQAAVHNGGVTGLPVNESTMGPALDGKQEGNKLRITFLSAEAARPPSNRRHHGHHRRPYQTSNSAYSEASINSSSVASGGTMSLGSSQGSSGPPSYIAYVSFDEGGGTGQTGLFLAQAEYPLGTHVIVTTEKDGSDLGRVTGTAVATPDTSGDVQYAVRRQATPAEVSHSRAVLSQEAAAAALRCQALVCPVLPHLTITGARYQYDRRKLTFFYTSNTADNKTPNFKLVLAECTALWKCRIWFERAAS